MPQWKARRALRRATDAVLRIGLPLAVLSVVIAVFLGERARIDHELQLVVPEAAPPGASVAMRALLFDRLDMPDGPRLARAPVEVRVLDRSGRLRARVSLAPSAAGGAEGTLALPIDLRGWVEVEAIARVDGEAVASVRTALEVRPDAPPDPLLGRPETLLSRLVSGPVQASGDPPFPFEARVVGGACVPEEQCELVVHVGEPAALVHLASSPSAAAGRLSPRAETSGLVLLPLVVHGPEAQVDLVATRGGVEVARRSLQLPVALATPAVSFPVGILESAARPPLTVHVLGDRPGVIVDGYQEGRWSRTASFAPSVRAVALPFALSPGTWRVQVRTDPFASDRSAVRVLVVRRAGEDERAAFDRAVRELAAREDATTPPGPPALRWAWVAASLEDRVHAQPSGVSGRGEDLARLEARRATLRVAAIVALLLGLVAAAVLFSRRGLQAALEAQRVMDATGDPELGSRRHRRRTLLSALAIVATVLLAFLGAAALIVARAHLFE